MNFLADGAANKLYDTLGRELREDKLYVCISRLGAFEKQKNIVNRKANDYIDT